MNTIIMANTVAVGVRGTVMSMESTVMSMKGITMIMSMGDTSMSKEKTIMKGIVDAMTITVMSMKDTTMIIMRTTCSPVGGWRMLHLVRRRC